MFSSIKKLNEYIKNKYNNFIVNNYNDIKNICMFGGFATGQIIAYKYFKFNFNDKIFNYIIYMVYSIGLSTILSIQIVLIYDLYIRYPLETLGIFIIPSLAYYTNQRK